MNVKISVKPWMLGAILAVLAILSAAPDVSALFQSADSKTVAFADWFISFIKVGLGVLVIAYVLKVFCRSSKRDSDERPVV